MSLWELIMPSVPPAEPTGETPLDPLIQPPIDTTLPQADSSMTAQDTPREQPLDTTAMPMPTEPRSLAPADDTITDSIDPQSS